jgi:hypothetical protein
MKTISFTNYFGLVIFLLTIIIKSQCQIPPELQVNQSEISFYASITNVASLPGGSLSIVIAGGYTTPSGTIFRNSLGSCVNKVIPLCTTFDVECQGLYPTCIEQSIFYKKYARVVPVQRFVSVNTTFDIGNTLYQCTQDVSTCVLTGSAQYATNYLVYYQNQLAKKNKISGNPEQQKWNDAILCQNSVLPSSICQGVDIMGCVNAWRNCFAGLDYYREFSGPLPMQKILYNGTYSCSGTCTPDQLSQAVHIDYNVMQVGIQQELTQLFATNSAGKGYWTFGLIVACALAGALVIFLVIYLFFVPKK